MKAAPFLAVLSLLLFPSQPAAQTVWSKQQLQLRVEELRSLSFRRSLQWKNISRQEGIEMMMREFRRIVPTEVDTPLHRILSVLEMVPSERSLEEIIREYFDRQLAGFYDTTDATLYVVDIEGLRVPSSLEIPQSSAAEWQRLILLHELTHALQDQHHSIDELLDIPSLRHSLDDALVRHALVEGEASLVAAMADFARLGSHPNHRDFRLPDTMTKVNLQALIMPPEGVAPWIHLRFAMAYQLGTTWIAQRWQEGGWAAVDALWKRPPPSTEAILHGASGFSRQKGPRLPDLRPGERPVLSLEFGEIGIAVWLAGQVGPQRAVRAAKGWAGDRAVLVTNRKLSDPGEIRDKLILASGWDTRADADQFAGAAQTWLRARPHLEWTIERNSYWVTLVITPPVRFVEDTIDLEADPWDGVEFGPSSHR